MTTPAQIRLAAAVFATAVSGFLGCIPANAAQERVLYSFADGTDGGGPQSRLAFDGAGNIYGTTHFGGIVSCGGQVGGGCGVVFELSANGKTWTETPLYAFSDGADGGFPNSGVIVDASGNLFGTASTGGSSNCSIGCGVAYELVKSPSWKEEVLHTFTGADGQFPNAELFAGKGGALYGTTWFGGAHGAGSVFALTPSSSGWSESVLYSFTGAQDGSGPAGGVVQDAVGDLYGTTYPFNGYHDGVSYALSDKHRGAKETVIDGFGSGPGGEDPYAGLVMDASGNLYGTTIEGGSTGDGVVFELERRSATHFKEKVLHTFTGGADGSTPYAGLTMDGSGNLYGATLFGGSGNAGTVYELARRGNGHFKERVLYGFSGGADGANPQAEPVLGPDGNLYGTTEAGGQSGDGTVYEIVL
jgi:uncharacterized repeat protein (TIGR03803 family)